jgi:branched-chain amino acid transport system permease protein
LGLLTFGVVLIALPLLPLPDYWIIELNYIGLYALPVLGLVLLTGVAGLISFGQAAFVGIGAYTTAYLTVTAGLSPWLTLWIGLLITAASAWLIGAITLRMSGHYLPLATMAWGLSLYYLMGNVDALGKYDGILNIPGLALFGLAIGQQRLFYVLVWAAVLLAALALLRLLDSRTGRAIRALARSPQMAEAMGIDTLRYKIGVFVLAALLASLSGWLFAHFQRTVNPSPFGLEMGIEYLFMAVLGGVGQVWGAIAGAGAVKVMEDQLQVWLPKLIGAAGSYQVIVFGILLVLLLKYLPEGLWAVVERRMPRAPRAADWADAAALTVRAKPQAGEVVLDVQALCKHFGGLAAVKDISFQTRAGQIVGLIGPNGAGKSTTFNLITGVLARSGGQVLLCGAPVHGLSARRGVARTFQHVKLIAEMTVLGNAALGAHLRGQRGAISAMLRLDRAEERQLFKEAERQLVRVGLGALLHEQAGNLAMGQQRLLEIGRALCADPTLLLLDEPATSLRYLEKQALTAVLRQLRDDGMGILLVEHDMGLVMDVCQHIVVMEFGTLLMQGTPVQVRQSIDLRAAPGSVITVIGPNDAGKSTLLNALIGVLPARGAIALDGRNIAGLTLEERVMQGIALVPEKRELFGTLSVQDNLMLGGFRQVRLGNRHWRERFDPVYQLFPRLQERRAQAAGHALGRRSADVDDRPRADVAAAPADARRTEPGTGAAHRARDLRTVGALRAAGVTIVLVEQNARAALDVADHGYVLEMGRVSLEGPARELARDRYLSGATLTLWHVRI